MTIEPIEAVVDAICSGRARPARVLADLDERSRDQRARLLAAAALGGNGVYAKPAPPLVRVLLRAGIDPDATTRQLPNGLDRGQVCLLNVVRRLHRRDRARNRAVEDSAIELVRGGATVRIADRWKKTPLHYAARFGASRLVAVLVAAGALADARDGDGETPLFEAARDDHVDVVRVLLAASKRRIANVHGETALDVAIAFGSTRAARELARRFGGETTIATELLDARTTMRLLARRASRRHSVMAPSGKLDPIIEKVLRGARVRDGWVELAIDPRAVAGATRTIRGELLGALGEEALRWLATCGVATRAYATGSLKPRFMLAGSKSTKRAAELVRALAS